MTRIFFRHTNNRFNSPSAVTILVCPYSSKNNIPRKTKYLFCKLF